MKDLKKTLTKGALGTVAAGAMALATATPAMAKDRNGGIGAEEVIAGALVVGGIAALAGAFDGDGDRKRSYRDRRYNGHNYNRGDNWNQGWRGVSPRQAINRCSRVAERQARRFGGYDFSQVTDIRDVDRTRRGVRVQGRIQVQSNRGWRGREFDRGRFTCFFDGRGRPIVEFRGIRGLR